MDLFLLIAHMLLLTAHMIVLHNHTLSNSLSVPKWLSYFLDIFVPNDCMVIFPARNWGSKSNILAQNLLYEEVFRLRGRFIVVVVF